MNRFNYKIAIVIGILGASLAWGFALTSPAYKQAKTAIKNNIQVKSKYGVNPFVVLYSFRINETSNHETFGGSGSFSYLLIGKSNVGSVKVTNKKISPGIWETESIHI